MSKLVQTAKRCKEILQNTKYKFDMSDWVLLEGGECCGMAETLKATAADENVCGTSYCLAGFLALEADYPKEYVDDDGYFDHIAFAEAAIGHSDLSMEYDFLFHGAWSSKLKLAHKRLDYVIEHDAVPDYDDWKEYGWYSE